MIGMGRANGLFLSFVIICHPKIYTKNVHNYFVQENVTLKARWGHSLTAVSLGPGLTKVVDFGGSPDSRTGSVLKLNNILSDTSLLQFSKCPHNVIIIILIYTPIHTCQRSEVVPSTLVFVITDLITN